MKLLIGGTEHEVADDVAQALERERSTYADELAAAETASKQASDNAERARARADAAEADGKNLRADIERVTATTKARFRLERQAAEVLGPNAKLDGMSDAEIKRELCERIFKFRIDADKTESYVDGMLDQALRQHRAPAVDELETRDISDAAPRRAKTFEELIEERNKRAAELCKPKP